MRLPIRLTLVIGLSIAVLTLVLGALVPLPARTASNSPYLNSLSDLSVKSAEAVPCNTVCLKSQGTYSCATDIANLACHIISPHECENLTGLCP